MFEAYKIAVSVVLEDEVTKGLSTIIASAAQATQSFKAMESVLASINRASKTLSKTVAETATATAGAAGGAATAATRSAADAVSRQVSIVTSQVAQLARLRQSVGTVDAGGGRGATAAPLLLAAPAPAEIVTRAGGAIGPAVSARRERYMGMVEEVEPEQLAGGGGRGGIVIPTAAGAGGGRRNRFMGQAQVVGGAAGAGGGGAGGGNGGGGAGGGAANNPMNLMFAGQQLRDEGRAGMSLIESAIDEAKKFEVETTRFASLGFGAKVTKEAEQFALGMNTFGTSARTNMTLVSDAMAVFKDLGHAELAAPIMARMKFANEALFGADGKAMDSKFMDMLKVIEFRRGLSSSAEFETQANYVQKVIAGSRNRVDATQLLTALKTGGVALSGRSNEAFYLGSEPLIQEFGGSRYGTGAMSIYQNLVQSRGTITAQQELYRLGLLNPALVEFNKLGKLKKALPGAFAGAGVLEKEGELALLEKVLLPAFAKKGITGEEDVIRELGMILGNRTGSSLMSRIYQQRATLHMQSEANRSAMGIDELTGAAGKTLQGKEGEAEAKWRNVLRELGMTVLPIAIKGVEGLTSILKGVIGFAQTFPTLTKGLVIGFAAISGALLMGGTILLATAGFFGLRLALGMLSGPASLAGSMLGSVLGTGLRIAGQAVLFLGRALLLNPIGLTITAIAAAAYLLWRNWDVIGPKLAAAWAAIKSTIGGFVDWIAAKWSWFKSLLPSGAFPTDPHMGKPGDRVSLPTGPLPTTLLPATHGSATSSPYVAGGKSQTVQVTSMVNLDGRKVAEAVSTHQARAAGSPLTGATTFDGSMFLAPVGL